LPMLPGSQLSRSHRRSPAQRLNDGVSLLGSLAVGGYLELGTIYGLTDFGRSDDGPVEDECGLGPADDDYFWVGTAVSRQAHRPYRARRASTQSCRKSALSVSEMPSAAAASIHRRCRRQPPGCIASPAWPGSRASGPGNLRRYHRDSAAPALSLRVPVGDGLETLSYVLVLRGRSHAFSANSHDRHDSCGPPGAIST